MDPPATADAASSSSCTSLRKRTAALSVNTSSSPSGSGGSRSRERESKARQEMEAADRGEEPMSPAGRLFRETHFNCYIVALLGLGAPVDVAAARAGLEATLVRHPRFSSLQTVNDVLIGVTSAALSRYYFRKTTSSDDTSGSGTKAQKNIRLRSAMLVNIRKTPGLHTLAEMMDSSKDNAVKWGNQIGYIVLPFHIAMHDDPLEYIRLGKKTADRKKRSLEAVFTYWSGNLVVKLLGIKAAAALCYGMFTNTTMSFSSLAGPAEKVEFYGHPIVYIATSVYGHPHALTVHFQSYMNIMKLVLAVDDEQFPDSHQLLDDFAESLRLVRQAASEKS
ncbi:hypothetical protein ACQ4PT_044818 [Festuca glaucescens]